MGEYHLHATLKNLEKTLLSLLLGEGQNRYPSSIGTEGTSVSRVRVMNSKELILSYLNYSLIAIIIGEIQQYC